MRDEWICRPCVMDSQFRSVVLSDAIKCIRMQPNIVQMYSLLAASLRFSNSLATHQVEKGLS